MTKRRISGRCVSRLAELSQERLDVLDELLRTESVEQVTRSRETLHRHVRELLEPPLGGIVDGATQARLAGENEHRRANLRDRVADEHRRGLVARRSRVDERGVDVAEVGDHALCCVKAAELTVRALPAGTR